MDDFICSSHSQSSAQNQKPEDKQISVEFDGFFYVLQTADSRLVNVLGLANGLVRNSICISGIMFNISSLSLHRPIFGSAPIWCPYCVIPRLTKRIARQPPFISDTSLRFIAFESRSELTRIESKTFSNFSNFGSICIPRSVETICESSFSSCSGLSLFTVESESNLTEIEGRVFNRCKSLQAIWFPASLQILHCDTFAGAEVCHITVEEGNLNFCISGDFLMDFDCVTIIRYVGSDETVTLSSEIETLGRGCFSESHRLLSIWPEAGSKLRRIGPSACSHCSVLQLIWIPASVEILGAGCFSYCALLPTLSFEAGSILRRIEARAFFRCQGLRSFSVPASVEILGDECFGHCISLSSLTFESGSKLFRIGVRALVGTSSLESIVIPRLIREMAKDWAWMSHLRQVTFESAASLQGMIERNEVDLTNSFWIDVEECDSDMVSLRSSLGSRFKRAAHQ
jgi:hypothetical protein